MILSCCIWALTEPEEVAHQHLHDLGFTAFDIRPSFLRSEEAEESRKKLGLTPCCIALSHELPKGAKIDTDNADALRLAIEHMKDGLEHAARRGVRWAYLVPEAPVDGRSVERYTVPIKTIAGSGQALGIRFVSSIFLAQPFRLYRLHSSSSMNSDTIIFIFCWTLGMHRYRTKIPGWRWPLRVIVLGMSTLTIMTELEISISV